MTTQPYAHPVRPSSAGDTTASTLALVGAALVGGVGCFMSLMTMAFVDGCTDSCEPDVLTRNATLMIVAALVIGLGGLVLTVVRLGQRRRAWPFALATLLLLVAVFGVGFTIQFAM